ncbi:hypothetical protein [Raoultibacter phocaeensis]|uniref:hypothetical protein n=1 Tax=Raoultibacter phocaeensis TaxID=2479841 RepID=UPI001118328A|nr:hypothetical protein [Raoultibacter phocaeensis]
MDATVTARVPVEVKEQVNGILKDIGSTPTELINTAYRYVLHSKRLPDTHVPAGKKILNLTDDEKSSLKAFLDRSAVKAPASWEGKTYKDLREEAMRDRYPDFLAEA